MESYCFQWKAFAFSGKLLLSVESYCFQRKENEEGQGAWKCNNWLLWIIIFATLLDAYDAYDCSTGFSDKANHTLPTIAICPTDCYFLVRCYEQPTGCSCFYFFRSLTQSDEEKVSPGTDSPPRKRECHDQTINNQDPPETAESIPHPIQATTSSTSRKEDVQETCHDDESLDKDGPHPLSASEYEWGWGPSLSKHVTTTKV